MCSLECTIFLCRHDASDAVYSLGYDTRKWKGSAAARNTELQGYALHPFRKVLDNRL